MKIFLDDIRFPKDPGWSIVRTYDDFLYMWAKNRETITAISFDHDLGGGDTGYDALKIVEHDILTGAAVHPDLRLMVHSMNPVGADAMRKVIDRLTNETGG